MEANEAPASEAKAKTQSAKDSERRERDRRRLKDADPRLPLAMFVLSEILDIDASDIGRMFGTHEAAVKGHLAETAAKWQSVASLPLSVAIHELRTLAA